MSAIRAWWTSVRATPEMKRAAAQTAAERSVNEAHTQVESVREKIHDDLTLLRKRQALTRAELQRKVDTQAPKNVLVTLSKDLKKIDKSISEKERLHSNIERERTQLQDTPTNTSVATAMMRSVEAQRSLQKLDLGDHLDFDDMLDDIEENRMETRTLSNRLANMGCDDTQDSCSDDDDFCANDVMIALGMSVSSSDCLLSDEIRSKLNRATVSKPTTVEQSNTEFEFPSVPHTRVAVAELRPRSKSNLFSAIYNKTGCCSMNIFTRYLYRSDYCK
jgi:hypothetical protein